MNQPYVPENGIINVEDSLNKISAIPTVDRRGFLKTLGGIAVVVTGAIIISGCATTPPRPPLELTEGMPNTLTYLNDKGEKETVPDLRGKWILVILENMASYNQEAEISQEKNTFIGTKTRGGVIVTGDFLRGVLEPNYATFRELVKNGPPWEGVKGTISPDLDTIAYRSAMAIVNLYRVK